MDGAPNQRPGYPNGQYGYGAGQPSGQPAGQQPSHAANYGQPLAGQEYASYNPQQPQQPYGYMSRQPSAQGTPYGYSQSPAGGAGAPYGQSPASYNGFAGVSPASGNGTPNYGRPAYGAMPPMPAHLINSPHAQMNRGPAGAGMPPVSMGMPSGGAPMSQEDIVVAQLRRSFPDVKEQTLHTAARVYRTYDAAFQWLETMRRQGLLSTNGSSAAPKRPTMTIREKFASRAGAGGAGGMGSMPGGMQQGGFGDQQRSFQNLRRKSKKYDDEFSDESASDNDESYDQVGQYEFEQRVLQFLNTSPKDSIVDVAGCTDQMAEAVINKRPYASLAQIQKVDIPIPADQNSSGEKRKRGAARKSAGSKIVDASLSTLRGYEAVDSLIQECAKLGKEVSSGIQAWGVDPKGNEPLEVIEIKGVGGDYFTEQPKLLGEGVELKNYQQVGVNWLSLLYNKKLSCILADEMGLGKTCQIISFFAHLKETKQSGPHLVVCPASTLENWLRELRRFCPSLAVEPYYGSQNERVDIRENIIAAGNNFDVMVTTYNLATGGKQDVGFLKSMRFNVCVYDEGHLLKNSQSERYTKLMKLHANFRVLLTGTPLQNNLRELVSLLSFILPSLFERNKEDLLDIFKYKAKATGNSSESSADSRQQLLSEQRIIKAKTMMSPFILRRRKDQVLQMLPAKSHEVVYCDMQDSQRALYDELLRKNRGEMREKTNELKKDKATNETATTKSKQAGLALDNVLMQLRKAALHPLLFRHKYTDSKLRKMTRNIMEEEQYKNASYDYIYEDMQYMNDYELNRLCRNFPTSMGKFMLDEDTCYMESGKMQAMLDLVKPMKAAGDRILIFSQFTQVLTLIEHVLNANKIKFLRLDGQTPVEERQDLIDQFHDNDDITVFLLSTKAGGFGINLAIANVVIIFDLSFNPHDDKQAEDRAHRVGQTRSVKVIRLITRDSIEENILELANTKLALDKHISEDTDDVDPESEAMVADMLLETAPTPAIAPDASDAADVNESSESESDHGQPPPPRNTTEPRSGLSLAAKVEPATDEPDYGESNSRTVRASERATRARGRPRRVVETFDSDDDEFSDSDEGPHLRSSTVNARPVRRSARQSSVVYTAPESDFEDEEEDEDEDEDEVQDNEDEEQVDDSEPENKELIVCLNYKVEKELMPEPNKSE